MKYVSGDLFDIVDKMKTTVVIPHICNNQGKWGAGFVISLGRKYPLAKQSYLDWYNNKTIDCEKIFYEDIFFELGNVQVVEVCPNRIYVANMIAQELGGERPLYYNHLCRCMDMLAGLIADKELPNQIVAPQFGSGLAGGNWNIIKQLIHDCWCRKGVDVTVVKYSTQKIAFF